MRKGDTLVISYPKLFNGMKLAGQLFAKQGMFQKSDFSEDFVNIRIGNHIGSQTSRQPGSHEYL